MTRFNPFRRPTPRELVARQLSETELSAINARAELEQHVAYVNMLNARTKRLRAELAELSKETPHDPQ